MRAEEAGKQRAFCSAESATVVLFRFLTGGCLFPPRFLPGHLAKRAIHLAFPPRPETLQNPKKHQTERNGERSDPETP